MFLPQFDVLCDLLLNRPTATWNLFVLYTDQKRKKTDTHVHTCLVPSLGIFLSLKRYLLSLFLFVFFILIIYSFFEKSFDVFPCSKQNNGENILQNGESLIAMKHNGSCCEEFL